MNNNLKIGRYETVVFVNFHNFSKFLCSYYGHEDVTDYTLTGGPQNKIEVVVPEMIPQDEYEEVVSKMKQALPKNTYSSGVGIKHYYLRDMICAAYMDGLIPSDRHVITDITP